MNLAWTAWIYGDLCIKLRWLARVCPLQWRGVACWVLSIAKAVRGPPFSSCCCLLCGRRPEIVWGLTSRQMSCFSLGTYLLQNFDHGPMRKRSKSYVTCWHSTCRNVQMLLCPIHFIRVKQHICHTCHNAIWGVRIVAYRATTDLVQWNYMLSGLCGLSVRCFEESGAVGCLPRPLLVGVVRQCRPSLCL